jgi:hypothetical protein
VNARSLAPFVAALLTVAMDARADDAPYVYTPGHDSPAATHTSTLDFQLEGGVASHRIFDIPIEGVDFSMGIGARTKTGGWRITMGGLIGHTDVGLEANEFRFGGSGELQLLPWLRLGGEGHWLYLSIPQAGGPTGWALGPGVRPYVAFDLLPIGVGRAFVSVSFEATLLSGSEASYVLWGPSADVGFHLF